MLDNVSRANSLWDFDLVRIQTNKIPTMAGKIPTPIILNHMNETTFALKLIFKKNCPTESIK